MWVNIYEVNGGLCNSNCMVKQERQILFFCRPHGGWRSGVWIVHAYNQFVADVRGGTGESYNAEVVVTATGGRKITKIDINQGVLNVRGKQEIEHLVLTAVNNALDQADHLMAEEMKHIMPNIPGLGMWTIYMAHDLNRGLYYWIL